MDSNINAQSSRSPTNPTFIGDSNLESIPTGSHGAQNSQTVESNAEGAANVEVGVEETNPFTSKKRKKTSACWQEFKEIEIPDGTLKAECIHCKLCLVIKRGGPISTLTRHLGLCPRRKVNQKHGQQTLSYQSAPSFSSSEPLMSSLTNFKYDQSKMREAVAQWVLMHNHPFNVVEEDSFNHMMRVGCPWYEKISRTTLKNDCVSVYEIEKKKIKMMLKKANKVSLTTDLWKSGQCISYMVVTAHFIDSDWNLQKRIINFVDVHHHIKVLILQMLSTSVPENGKLRTKC